MKIYLFRHAQKAMDFTGDPDLTIEGHSQASKVLDKVLKGELPQPTELWVSPKKRTLSTFRPLSRHFKLDMQIQETLLEQQSDETLTEFRQRIERLLLFGTQTQVDSVIFICTHYDWVAEAMNVVPSDTDLSHPEYAHWNPCQYIGFSKTEDGLFEMIELKRI